MKNVAVIYGGSSCEKDISVITGVQMLNALKKTRYNIYPMYLKGDVFTIPERAEDVRSYMGEKLAYKECALVGKSLYIAKNGKLRRRADIDCALVCTHGGKGENGALQGYLEMNGVPYTSPSVLPSALGMNKIICKAYFAQSGLNVLPYVIVDASSDADEAQRTVESELGYPVIVKPAEQGSSIGIAVAQDGEAFRSALAVARKFGDDALVERALTDFREINCAYMKSQGSAIYSSPEQPLLWSDFLSFEDKYMANGKMSGGGRIFPALLTALEREEIYGMAEKISCGLKLKGITRMDFLIDNSDGKAYINEINTVPGSLACYLFADRGLGVADVLTRLIEEAVSDAADERRANFETEVLANYYKGSANACKIGGKIL